MPKATFQFPKNFLWGTATSSHQVEGQNTNNSWSQWENEADRILENQKAGKACDWWAGRWKEDFDRAQESGQNAHRLSIEWSRVQPARDRWDENALDYYREMIRGLVNRGITPMVTLHHFSDPIWLMEQGGWENDDTPILFEKYVYKVVQALKEYVNLWVTINEPNIYTYFGYLEGTFPPGKKSPKSAYIVMRNLLRGHTAAYHCIHRAQIESRVGIAHHIQVFKPARTWSPLDKWITNLHARNFNLSFADTLINGKFRFLFKSEKIKEAINTQDFFGLNYYSTSLVRFSALAFSEFLGKHSFPPDTEISPSNFIANVPEGLFTALKWAQRSGLPILVTENGIEDASDDLRRRYLVEHLNQLWRAYSFHNTPIIGYFHWSLLDNFEWERGWSQRFGLWGLNVDTQQRIRRPSVDLYAEICRTNALDSDIVLKFALQSFKKLFPG
ncbi:MAG: glycoside hydrolase family 1 protein [Anaerolineaceae bacterium]|nr:glycoside hydrolase family 1 protein [Anaerolineaceae bacterium]